MSDPSLDKESERSALPSSKPLDETVWRNWLMRNAQKEAHRNAVRMEAVRWICVALLVLAAIAGSQTIFAYPDAYATVTQFAVTIGAIVFVQAAYTARRYSLASVFFGIAILCNPLLSGRWLFASWPLLLASTLPFIFSGIRGDEKPQVPVSLPEITRPE